MRERAVAERNGDKARLGRERRRLDSCGGNTLQNCQKALGAKQAERQVAGSRGRWNRHL